MVYEPYTTPLKNVQQQLVSLPRTSFVMGLSWDGYGNAESWFRLHALIPARWTTDPDDFDMIEHTVILVPEAAKAAAREREPVIPSRDPNVGGPVLEFPGGVTPYCFRYLGAIEGPGNTRVYAFID
jgi:hypothetical protein